VLPTAAALAQGAAPATSEQATRGGVGDPRTRAKLHTELAALYFQDGNMAVALDELATAISADSSYAPAYNVRGLVHVYLREIDLAERDFKYALGLAERDPEINNNYGWFLCQVGREKESITYFMRALQNPLYQTPERAWLNAGQCSLKIGDTVSAEDYFQKSLRFAPDNAAALLQLAAISWQRGNAEAARSRFGELAHKVELNAEALWLGVRIEHSLGDRVAETSYATQLRRRFPASPEYQKLLKGEYE
jgi:type IV pilus assembly protein PilF